jgi:hypothetical protein
LRSRRKRLLVATLVLVLGFLCIALNASWKYEFLAPGPLSDSHAQLLQRTSDSAPSTSNRCGACHPAGKSSPSEWAASLFGVQTSSSASAATSAYDASQTQLCLTCHAEKLSEFAALPHSLPVKQLATVTEQTQGSHGSVKHGRQIKTNDAGEIACAVCHQEHHGRNHHLSMLTNQQCSNCHQSSFDDFARSHPEFHNWPPQQRSGIVFGHEAHQFKHFPSRRRNFDCVDCHGGDSDSEIVSIRGYAQCAECHDAAISIATTDGLRLLQLPLLDVAAFEPHDIAAFHWPEAGQGSFDGPLEPLMFLLLLADKEAEPICRAWGVDGDFYDVDPDDAQAVQRAAILALAMKRLADDLATAPEQTVQTRLTQVLGADRSFDASSLVSALPPDLVKLARRQWFGEDAITIDEQDPDTSGTSEKAAGWHVDDATLRIWYRPIGHADPVLQACIELATIHTTDSAVSAAQDRLLTSPLVSQCTVCHRASRGTPPTWNSPPSDLQASFTKFSHRPHLVLPQLRDCQTCHQPRETAAIAVSAGQDQHYDATSDFLTIKKQTCVACHTNNAAGESCLQCHNYHIHAAPRFDIR